MHDENGGDGLATTAASLVDAEATPGQRQLGREEIDDLEKALLNAQSQVAVHDLLSSELLDSLVERTSGLRDDTRAWIVDYVRMIEAAAVALREAWERYHAVGEKSEDVGPKIQELDAQFKAVLRQAVPPISLFVTDPAPLLGLHASTTLHYYEDALRDIEQYRARLPAALRQLAEASHVQALKKQQTRESRRSQGWLVLTFLLAGAALMVTVFLDRFVDDIASVEGATPVVLLVAAAAWAGRHHANRQSAASAYEDRLATIMALEALDRSEDLKESASRSQMRSILAAPILRRGGAGGPSAGDAVRSALEKRGD